MSFIRKIKKGNRTYLAEVENLWIDGKCVQKHIRYVGKEVDGNTILASSISNIEVEQVKVYGPLLVLNYLAEKINLHEILGTYNKEILSLVYAHCLDYKSINKMEDWFKRTDLNLLLNFDSLTEKRLLDALDNLNNQDSEMLHKKIFNNIEKHYPVDSSCIVYDVTNTYLYGKNCTMGKYGHDKEGVKGRPLIQIGLGVTYNHGIPVFHKVYDGNVHDARTLQDMATNFSKFDIKNGLIVYDRGIASSDNIRDFKKMSCDTLCGLSIKGKLKDIIRQTITKTEFIKIDNRVKLNKTVFYAEKISHAIDGVAGILIVCFNEQQRKDLRESRYDEIENAKILLADKKAIKSGLEKFFDDNGKINYKALEDAEEFDGYSCIFSTKDMQTEEVIRLYFDKDVIEKAFRSIKGVTKLQPIRHWLYDRVNSHVFICYLSYLLLSLLKYHLRKLQISPVDALLELSSMYKVYLRDSKKDFRISRVVSLTKIQENIIKSLDKKLLIS